MCSRGVRTMGLRRFAVVKPKITRPGSAEGSRQCWGMLRSAACCRALIPGCACGRPTRLRCRGRATAIGTLVITSSVHTPRGVPHEAHSRSTTVGERPGKPPARCDHAPFTTDAPSQWPCRARSGRKCSSRYRSSRREGGSGHGSVGDAFTVEGARRVEARSTVRGGVGKCRMCATQPRPKCAAPATTKRWCIGQLSRLPQPRCSQGVRVSHTDAQAHARTHATPPGRTSVHTRLPRGAPPLPPPPPITTTSYARQSPSV